MTPGKRAQRRLDELAFGYRDRFAANRYAYSSIFFFREYIHDVKNQIPYLDFSSHQKAPAHYLQ